MNVIESIKNLLLESGSVWVLWLLGVLSFISVVIIIERCIYFRNRSANLELLAQRLDLYLSEGEYARAIEELEANPSTAAAVAAAGLKLADRGVDSADKAMLSATALQKEKCEKWLAYLGTVGNNAPFVGLFGTVVGVIGAFEKLGQSTAGAAATSAASNAGASQAVMASIAEALVATALGIVVALPAVAAYNYFQRRMMSLLSGSEVLSNIVLAYISDVNAPHAAKIRRN